VSPQGISPRVPARVKRSVFVSPNNAHLNAPKGKQYSRAHQKMNRVKQEDYKFVKEFPTKKEPEWPEEQE
jgi:hypothetical protein